MASLPQSYNAHIHITFGDGTKYEFPGGASITIEQPKPDYFLDQKKISPVKDFKMDVEIQTEWSPEGLPFIDSLNNAYSVNGKTFILPPNVKMWYNDAIMGCEFSYTEGGYTERYTIYAEEFQKVDDPKQLIDQAIRRMAYWVADKKVDKILKAAYDAEHKWKSGHISGINPYMSILDEAAKYKLSQIAPAEKGHQSLQAGLKKLLPANDKSILSVRVDCPGTYAASDKYPEEECAQNDTVYSMIQHLNDAHKWDRATQIADWLDTLHDDGIIDITIESPDPDKA